MKMSPYPSLPITGRLAMTLIETVIVLIVAVAAMTAGSVLYSNYLDDLASRAGAQQLKQVSQALGRYVQDKHLSLVALLPNAGDVTSIDINDLKPAYLPQDFTNLTPYNHRYFLKVRRPSASDETLQAIVYTEYSDVNFALEPNVAAEMARLAGASGGYTNASVDPQQVISAYGQYQLSLSDYASNPGGGVMVSAAFVDYQNDASEKYLHRHVTGNTEHNRMRTGIDMDANNLANVGQIQTQSLSASGHVSANTAQAESLAVGSGGLASAGAITTSSQLSASRAQLSRDGVGACCGDPGTLSLSENTPSTGRRAGISLHNANVHEGNIELAGSGSRRIRFYDNQGHGMGIEATGRIQTNEFLQVDGVASEGSGCSPNGLIGRTASGKLLSCDGGLWRASAGGAVQEWGPFQGVLGTYHLGQRTFCALTHFRSDDEDDPGECRVYKSGNDWYLWVDTKYYTWCGVSCF